jgi:hypothetical protein
MIYRVAMLASILVVATATTSCSQPTNDAAPIATSITVNGPVGMFFMTRYWSYTRTLEKAAWYFASDGHVYQNLREGFSPADLANHQGPKGTFAFQNNTLTVKWADGKTTSSDIERDMSDASVFMWEMGIFTPVKPFADANAAVGNYDGGESVSGAGNVASTAMSLQLSADGSYASQRAGFVKGIGDQATLEGGASGQTTGRWAFSGYSLVLTGSDGKTTRGIFFPVDDDTTPIKPDHAYFAGLLLKKM